MMAFQTRGVFFLIKELSVSPDGVRNAEIPSGMILGILGPMQQNNISGEVHVAVTDIVIETDKVQGGRDDR